MKKTIVVVTLALLLLSMVSTASADEMTEFEDGCYYVEIKGNYYMTENPTPYNIDMLVEVCKSTDGIAYTVLADNSLPGLTIDNLEFSKLSMEEIIINASGNCDMGCLFTGTMTFIPEENNGMNYVSSGASGTVSPYAGSQCPLPYPVDVTGSFEASIETYEEYIPEFPTIALPMVAILGLAFIMLRRKD